MKSFIFALLLGFSIISNAQNKVIGAVLSSQNKGLSGVNVSIPEIHKETSTDSKGNYELNNLPLGNFKIVFSSLGFETTTKQYLSKEKITTIDVILLESVHQLDEVIVSTIFNKLQSQNVMKVAHESVKSLQQKGATTLVEGLATIPGVSQISTGTSIGKPVISHSLKMN